MQFLTKKETEIVCGAGISEGTVWSVWDYSVLELNNDYIFFAHSVMSPSGKIIYKGDYSNFMMDEFYVQTFPLSDHSGTCYIIT